MKVETKCRKCLVFWFTKKVICTTYDFLGYNCMPHIW